MLMYICTKRTASGGSNSFLLNRCSNGISKSTHKHQVPQEKCHTDTKLETKKSSNTMTHYPHLLDET